MLASFSTSVMSPPVQAGLLVFVLLPFFAQAADTLEAAPFAPFSVRKVAPTLSIEQLDVDVHGREAVVRIDVKNELNSAIQQRLGFFLPSFKWEGLSNDYFDKNFPELTIQVGRKKIRPSVTANAILGQTDVTHLLTKLGFNPLMVASAEGNEFPSQGEPAGHNAQRLMMKGLFKESDGVYYPTWNTAVSYQWTQQFPKSSYTKVIYKYRLRPGFGIARIGEDAINSALATNCASIAQVKSLINEMHSAPEFFLFEVFEIPLSDPAPKRVKINFTPQALNDSFVPLTSFSCFNHATQTDRPMTADFSMAGSNATFIRFVTISYQKSN